MSEESIKKIELPAVAEDWLTELHTQNHDHTLLRKACELILTLTVDKDAQNIHDLFERGIAITRRLEKLKCDDDTIVAGMLYPTFLKSDHEKDKIAKELGENVAKLLVGTFRMEAIGTIQNHPTEFSQQQNQMDNLRKMLLAMVDDIRVVLIKLAECLVRLEHLQNQLATEQERIAKQAMDLYAPLANRLGIGQFKWEIEDLAFRYLDPETYMAISKALKMRRKDRETYIQHVIEKLHGLLKETGIKEIKISGRPKHIYSIDRKIKRKQVDFSEIYDASAIRILVPTVEDCYTALGIVHTTWPPIAKEFDDYIVKPKPNGYQSIHTAVAGPENKNREIQIRTFEMNNAAELGVAAHWKYKEGQTNASTYEEKITWLREVMGWQKEISVAQHDLYKNLFNDRVYIFTPNGDILDLEAGATPLDFAYHIHTEIGHRCRGAKVNGALVQLTQPLKTGDRVEIQTIKSGHPSRDWLNLSLGYLKTNAARNKVKHWFRQLDRNENIKTGETLWEKASRRASVSKNILKDVIADYNLKSVEDLLAAIGAGDIGVTHILNQIHGDSASPKKTTPEPSPEKIEPLPQKESSSRISIEGIGNVLTQLALCCQPIPGDPIIGYITKGRGITIHKSSCRNIRIATQERPERIINVSWGKNLPKKYPVALSIEADDRPGLLRDISNTTANERVTILGVNTRVNRSNHRAHISLTVEIKQLESLHKLIRELKQVPDILTVQRR